MSGWMEGRAASISVELGERCRGVPIRWGVVVVVVGVVVGVWQSTVQ
jgi:hypothetical protein